ncbi:MAG: hypothetical protein Q9190_007410 [Brigantiaea leucoxantha]
MAGAQDHALDEIQWRSQEIAQSMGGIHTNTSRHRYTQYLPSYNPDLLYLIQTRDAFEARLRTMQGLEFMVSHDPSEGGQKVEHSKVWVIRKQQRRKKVGAEDEITALSSYFVIGENVYMAPTVGSILSSRLLAIVSSLNSLLSTSATLPTFTSSTGHTYRPPPSKHPSLLSSASTSAINTQQQQHPISSTSKESTPLPGSSTQDSSQKPATSFSHHNNNNINNDHNLLGEEQEEQLLSDSYRLYLRYGHEFMDENPLIGEPGSFILSKSQSQSQLPSSQLSQSKLLPASSTLSTKPATPTPTLNTENLPPVEIRKRKDSKSSAGGGGGPEKSPIEKEKEKDKKVRRKSKPAVTTPK